MIACGTDAGKVLYTPAADYNGPDSYSYKVCDNGTTNGAPDSKCATATVSVTVTEVNDAPAASYTPASPSVLEDGSGSITLIGSDQSRNANLTFKITDLPDHGTLKKGGSPLALNDTYVGSGASVVYEPAANYNGQRQLRVPGDRSRRP